MQIGEILLEARLDVLQQLSAIVYNSNLVKVVKRPQTCLLMMQAVDSVEETPFYLGEVLVTEARAEVNGVLGVGLVMEEQPERAWLTAVINAALSAEVAEQALIKYRLEEEARLIVRRYAREQELVSGTKVEFDIMGG